MNFKRYQKEAMKFAEFNDPLYPFFALPEETGELIGLIAKWRRGDVDEVENNSEYDAVVSVKLVPESSITL